MIPRTCGGADGNNKAEPTRNQKQNPHARYPQTDFFSPFVKCVRLVGVWLACMMRCEREEDLFMLVHAVFRFRSPSAIVLLIIPSESTLRVVMPSTYTWLGPERGKERKCFSRGYFSLISPAYLRVRHMGRTCRWRAKSN